MSQVQIQRNLESDIVRPPVGGLRRILQPFDKRECISLKESSGIVGKSESTMRAWVEEHGLGRRIGGGTWSVSRSRGRCSWMAIIRRSEPIMRAIEAVISLPAISSERG
jgi:hypothetical protein